jgi:hypothetical protein
MKPELSGGGARQTTDSCHVLLRRYAQTDYCHPRGVHADASVFHRKPRPDIPVDSTRPALCGAAAINARERKGKSDMNEETTTQETPAAAAPAPAGAPPGIWEDLTTRVKAGERDALLSAGAFGLAMLQSVIGTTGGALLTTAMLLNLALIGWLGHAAHGHLKRGGGKGLLVLNGAAFALAALSILMLAEALSGIVNTARAFEAIETFDFQAWNNQEKTP